MRRRRTQAPPGEHRHRLRAEEGARLRVPLSDPGAPDDRIQPSVRTVPVPEDPRARGRRAESPGPLPLTSEDGARRPAPAR